MGANVKILNDVFNGGKSVASVLSRMLEVVILLRLLLRSLCR